MRLATTIAAAGLVAVVAGKKKENIFVQHHEPWPMDPDFMRGVQMGAFIVEEGDEDEFKCPKVPTPGFLSWIDYAEPAKVALLQYANEGNPIPELDMLQDSITRVFKIWKVFDKNYEAD